MDLRNARAHILWVAISLAGWLLPVAPATQAQPPAGQNERKGWQQLDLRETTLAGIRIFYEPAMEPNLPSLEQELAKVSADRDKLAGLVARRDEIVGDINRILGVTDPNLTQQQGMFGGLAGMSSQTRISLYVAKQSTVKDFLRAGGQLPGFSYNRESDSGEYTPQRFQLASSTKPPETWESWIPEELASQPGATSALLSQMFGCGLMDTVVHEVTEITLLGKAHLKPPYGRWFTDGFANAITHKLIEKYVGREAAAAFAAKFDPQKYQAIEKEINLRYWLLGGFGIYLTDIPVAPEAEISLARYAFATLEAERLIDAHGMDCVREILDKIAAKDDRSDVVLLEVIKDVTGEDMGRRLLQYQTFTLTEDGIANYARASRDAESRKEMERMFITQVRLLELRSGTPSNLCLQHFLGASVLLSVMGHPDAAEEAMQNCVRVYSAEGITNGRPGALQAYIMYALNCKKARKADKFADEMLTIIPNHVNSLTVKMLVRAEDKDTAQARDYATRIRSLATKDSTPYELATKILGVDPNTPAEYKGPAQ